jgi:ATP-dependent 26S proteasome regulatory subunit
MSTPPDPFESLREALRISPDNIPLRLHLADSLAQRGMYEQSETELREALKLAPNNDDIKLKLANVYLQQNKATHALVIVEEMMSRPESPPAAYIMHARLLLNAGEVERAVRLYKDGVNLDPDVADESLADTLGIDADMDQDVVDGQMRATWEGPEEHPDIDLQRPDLTFSDVGGMNDLKEEIQMKIIHPLQHPELYEAYGKKIGGGILMYGPPGCGKTHMARATAGEINASFLSVGISDVLDMWIGKSEQNLHELFQTARRNKPCVLFFDEVDALGASRSDMRQSAGRHLINQFLSEMDGVDNSNDGVLILGATNAPWHLDSAFRRPGRFDRILFVPPPDDVAREEILRVMVRGKPIETINFKQVAKKSPSFSGADLKAVIDSAIEAKLREAIKTGIPAPLTTKDLVSAAKSIKPSTKEWFSTAKNYALYSNAGGVYDDILDYLKLK